MLLNINSTYTNKSNSNQNIYIAVIRTMLSVILLGNVQLKVDECYKNNTGKIKL